MIRTGRMGICTAVCLLVLTLCITTPTALAASDATAVIISGATLTAANPYWKSSGGGSSTDWELWFDTTTSIPTLRMKDVTLNTLNSSNYILQIDGNVILELYGNNTLTYSGSVTGLPIGLISYGTILIQDGTADGTGKLNINMNHNSTYSSAFSVGLYNLSGPVTIDSGTVDITIYDNHNAYGIYAWDGLTVRGGITEIDLAGGTTVGINTNQYLQSGGTVSSSVNGTGTNVTALVFNYFLMTGGYGEFTAVETGYGAEWFTPSANGFRFLGGHAVFSAGEFALLFDTTDDTVNPGVNGVIYVSDYSSGIDKVLWNPTMTLLAYNYNHGSAYPYVEMVEAGMPVSQPQTGDVSRPWLWVGIGAAVLLLGAGALLLYLKKRK